jgi:hypothetical protein
MIHHMDEGIGWVMDALRRHGMADDTLVVFTSDNGGERFSDNWPLVGGKMDLTEGGIRVPWIAHWPAAIAPGGESRQQCMTMDWSATMLDAAGAKGRPGLPARWRVAAAGAARCRHPFPAAALAHEPPRPARDARRPLEVPARGRPRLPVRHPPTSASAPTTPVGSPSGSARMRADWEAWNATMPPIPEDATVSLGYSVKDMPQR